MKWLTASRASAVLLTLVLIAGVGNLWATQREQASQRKQGQLIEHRLCRTFARLAARQPPAGNPALNPARAYLQGQHATLDEIPADIGCGKGSP